MQSDKMLMTTAITLALAVPGLAPAHAADEAAKDESAQTRTSAQSQQTAGDKIDIVTWAQEDYERLMAPWPRARGEAEMGMEEETEEQG